MQLTKLFTTLMLAGAAYAGVDGDGESSKQLLAVLRLGISTSADKIETSVTATYYVPGLGACGETNTAGQLVAAVSAARFDSSNPCGKTIKVYYQGKTVYPVVVDRCAGCALNDVDLSPAAFSVLANQALGRIKVSWKFV